MFYSLFTNKSYKQKAVIKMGQKVLIVDDEAHIRMLIEQTLEELEDEGVEFLTAENGEIALEIIQKENPKLVFLDVMMPKMNGMEVCRRVKKELELKNIFIVLLTAKGQELDRQRGQEVGADVYMTKPFDPEIILSKAKEVLGIE
jgi:two-component system, OmpR family, alkaline phosphatase synthesis response regulator PhoP